MIVKFEVKFDETGRAGMLGLTPDDMAAMGMTGIGLPPDMLGKIQGANIQNIEFRTKPEGAFIYANGEPLPTLIWDTQLLANLMELIKQLAPDAPVLPLLEAMVPYLDRADVGVMLHFPVAEGQTPIPAQMHD
jgi:hypothetical protein